MTDSNKGVTRLRCLIASHDGKMYGPPRIEKRERVADQQLNSPRKVSPRKVRIGV
jgi:hypothetical protein